MRYNEREVVAVIRETRVLGKPHRNAYNTWNGTESYIEDNRKLWTSTFMLHGKGELAGIAHSHPGAGYPSPSTTDLETFDAMEKGLGTRITWWITSRDKLVEIHWDDHQNEYITTEIAPEDEEKVGYGWLSDLRKRSRYYRY